MVTLNYGSSSREVEALQKRLQGYKLPVKVTGTLDDQTVSAVNTLSPRIGLNASFQDVDDRFFKALAAWEKQKFYQVTIGGRKFLLTEAELGKLRKTYADKAEAEVMPYVRLAEEAKMYWDAHKKVKSENWFWGNVVEITTRASFPDASTMDGAVKAAQELRSKARALTLTPAELDRSAAKIQTAMKEMSAYRRAIFDDGEDVITVLKGVRDGCVLVLQIGAAVGTGGASLSAQVAAGMAVAGYAQALTEVEKAGTQSNYKIEMGLERVAWAVGVDGLVTAIFKGAKGKEMTELLKKRIIGESAKPLAKYIAEAVAKSLEGLISDGIKAIPKLMDPTKKLTQEEILKAATEAFIKNAGIGLLGPVAEKYSKSAAKQFSSNDVQAWAKGRKLDKAGLEAVQKAVDAVSGSVVEAVLSGWKPASNHAKFEGEVRKQIAASPSVQAALKKAAK